MFFRATVALACAHVVVGKKGVLVNNGHKSSHRWIPREQVGPAPSAESLVAEEDVPESFDPRNLNGQNFVTDDWNQHLPKYCGACWIHGTLSALNDRIKLMRRGQFPDVRLGRQSILNCVPDPADPDAPPPGCNGGDAYMIHQWMHENRVPDDTCMPYQGENMGCTADTFCRNCKAPQDGGYCFPIRNYIGYGVSSYGIVAGEKAMMKEIWARGPIVCSFAAGIPFVFNYSENALRNEGVFVSLEKKTPDEVDHDMEIAGWGVTPGGRKYWIVRNSWGTYWGETGWLKLERGVNSLLSERDCAWAVPTWDELDENLEGKTYGDYAQGVRPDAFFGHPWTPPLKEEPAKSPDEAPWYHRTPGAITLSKGDAALSTATLVTFTAIVTALVTLWATGRQRRIREPALILG